MQEQNHIHRRELLRRASVLLGASLSAPAVVGILNGCTATPPPADWSPETLTAEHLAVVAEVAEIIIPRTDTPGARDVGVPAFIDTMLREVYPAADRQHYLDGLADFQRACREQTGRDFLGLPAADRARFLQRMHDSVLEARGPAVQRPFLLTTKELTLLGYFTSEAGATQVLQYDAVPGAYHGCQPLAEAGNGRTWAEDKPLPF